jgi:hypothetical protein
VIAVLGLMIVFVGHRIRKSSFLYLQGDKFCNYPDPIKQYDTTLDSKERIIAGINPEIIEKTMKNF